MLTGFYLILGLLIFAALAGLTLACEKLSRP
jgi:hypothetical protein